MARSAIKLKIPPIGLESAGLLLSHGFCVPFAFRLMVSHQCNPVYGINGVDAVRLKNVFGVTKEVSASSSTRDLVEGWYPNADCVH